MPMFIASDFSNFRQTEKYYYSTAIETHLFHGKSKPVYCPAQTLNRKSSTGSIFNLVRDFL